MTKSWLELWRELVETSSQWGRGRRGGRGDAWQERAQEFDQWAREKRGRPDRLRDFVLAQLGPSDTVLDIGAGTGGWAIPMARLVKKVTAIDPSPAMLSHLRKNIAAEGLANIEVVEGQWEDVDVPGHDVALCSHAIYGSPDLASFVGKMERSARRACYLVLRLPNLRGAMAELCCLVKGHPYDSPNFIVAYNALLEMGIFPNALSETELRPWTDPTLEEAVQRARKHLLLRDDSYDAALREVLARRLEKQEDGLYYWPDGMRSGLIWWEWEVAP